jgi:cyclohexadieny/prephenate dehydrogenase / 3-phosphoshikimate 1-carboxyvinyltransferase
MSLTFHIQPGGSLQGSLRVPGDKSISHRSIMLGALADGVTEVTGFLEGEDALATMRAFRNMGVKIDGPQDGRVRIEGVGRDGLKQPDSVIDCGNSGTTMRLLTGLLAGQGFEVTLDGDASLRKRPMERVAKPLRLMGAQITTGEQGRPPVHIKPVKGLKAIHYDLPVASAQIKSAVLLAGLFAEGDTSVTEPEPTRDHSERMLLGFGVPVHRSGSTARLTGGARLKAAPIQVPGDISSAAFFLVAASIAPESDLLLVDVGMNPTRTGIVDILRLMGADISIQNERIVGGEPIADLRVRSAPLHGIDVPESLVPLAIDEFPVIFIAAACAEGVTKVSGAAELRVKESDRIQVMADGLHLLGVEAHPTEDGMIIHGGKPFHGATIESHGDHRIAMSFSVAALRATSMMTVNDADNVATSFPGFVTLAAQAGLGIQVA